MTEADYKANIVEILSEVDTFYFNDGSRVCMQGFNVWSSTTAGKLQYLNSVDTYHKDIFDKIQSAYQEHQDVIDILKTHGRPVKLETTYEIINHKLYRKNASNVDIVVSPATGMNFKDLAKALKGEIAKQIVIQTNGLIEDMANNYENTIKLLNNIKKMLEATKKINLSFGHLIIDDVLYTIQPPNINYGNKQTYLPVEFKSIGTLYPAIKEVYDKLTLSHDNLPLSIDLFGLTIEEKIKKLFNKISNIAVHGTIWKLSTDGYIQSMHDTRINLTLSKISLEFLHNAENYVVTAIRNKKSNKEILEEIYNEPGTIGKTI